MVKYGFNFIAVFSILSNFAYSTKKLIKNDKKFTLTLYDLEILTGVIFGLMKSAWSLICNLQEPEKSLVRIGFGVRSSFKFWIIIN
jgi:hypothetical protein